MGKLLDKAKKSLPKASSARFKCKNDKTDKTTVSDVSHLPNGSKKPFNARLKLSRNKTAENIVSASKSAKNPFKIALKHKKRASVPEKTTESALEPPKLVRRRENRASSFKMGRTIAEKRERLETANERAAARKKDKKRNFFRVLFTIIGFAGLAGLLIAIFLISFGGGEPADPIIVEEPISLTPTIPVTDENTGSSGKITSRMSAYVARAERDFRDLGYKPIKAVVPNGAIREIDFYLEDRPGYIKMTIDRDSAVSAEDADRLYRYLASINVTNFAYIDVRIDGKAYYKPLAPPEPLESEPSEESVESSE